MNSDRLTIIVPTAGVGRRMKSYGPKSLIELFTDETILSRQLAIFEQCFPFAEVIFVVGFESDKIVKKLPKNVKVIENELFETTGVVRSIGMGLRVASNDSVMVVYGDTVFDEEAITSLFREESAIAAYTAGKKDEVGIITNSQGYAENLTYISKKSWSHLAFFPNKELDMARRFCYNRSNYMKFGFELLNEIIDRGGKFKVIEDSFAIDIDTYSDLNFTKDLVKYK